VRQQIWSGRKVATRVPRALRVCHLICLFARNKQHSLGGVQMMQICSLLFESALLKNGLPNEQSSPLMVTLGAPTGLRAQTNASKAQIWARKFANIRGRAKTTTTISDKMVQQNGQLCFGPPTLRAFSLRFCSDEAGS